MYFSFKITENASGTACTKFSGCETPSIPAFLNVKLPYELKVDARKIGTEIINMLNAFNLFLI